jgi:hypothetical protein
LGYPDFQGCSKTLSGKAGASESPRRYIASFP